MHFYQNENICTYSFSVTSHVFFTWKTFHNFWITEHDRVYPVYLRKMIGYIRYIFERWSGISGITSKDDRVYPVYLRKMIGYIRYIFERWSGIPGISPKDDRVRYIRYISERWSANENGKLWWTIKLTWRSPAFETSKVLLDDPLENWSLDDTLIALTYLLCLLLESFGSHNDDQHPPYLSVHKILSFYTGYSRKNACCY